MLDDLEAILVEVRGQVVPDAADPGEVLVHPGAREELEEVKEQLPLPEGPQEAREEPEVRPVRGEPHQVARDPLKL